MSDSRGLLRLPRRARWGALLAAGATLVGLPWAAIGAAAPQPAAPAAAPCSATPLPTLGGSQGSALAVSSNGLVVGLAADRTGTQLPVLWQAGRARQLVTGLISVTPVAVNSRGEVVGTGVEAASLDQVGWYWRAGRTTLLKARPGFLAIPEAIADTGQIVGALGAADDGASEPTSGEPPERAASWASGTAAPTVLPPLPGDVGAHAYGVNDKGVVVGNSQADGHFTPVVWRGGRVKALPGSTGWGIARSVDDTGLIAGSVSGTGGTEAVTWGPSGKPGHHGNGGGHATQVRGVEHGRAVGQAEVRGSDDVDRPRALVWNGTNSSAQTLPPLRGDPGAGVNAANGDQGAVVGFSSDARQARRPVMWRCGK